MSPPGREPLLPDVGVVALPYHHWSDRWMTPHHVLPRLAGYFRVVWLEPAHHWREIRAIDRRPSAPEVAALLPKGFDRYVPEAWLPDVYRPDWLRRAVFRARLRRAWRRLDRVGCRARVLHLWHPQFEHALDVRQYHLSLYHIDDEYAFTTDAPPVGVQEARVLRRVDQVFAISPLLMERKGGINANMSFAPEGVDFPLYATPVREPVDLAPIPHPRIGYTGHLKTQLDWLLLRNLARLHPEWSFVLVGPRKALSETQTSQVADMAAMGNVHFLGPKTVTELSAYPQHFDVCIMPYTVDGYTNNIYPLKLHEYLASGTPIVGSPIRTLRDFREVVSVADTLEDWSAALAAALDPAVRSPAATAARQDTARHYDWGELIYGIAETICRRLGPEYLRRLKRVETSVESAAGPAVPRPPASNELVSVRRS
jgi:glycosyltransferase involved in cell wall biosynthesis